MYEIDSPITDKNVIMSQKPEKRDLNTSSEPKMGQNKNSMRDSTSPLVYMKLISVLGFGWNWTFFISCTIYTGK